jgi:hypothetical protein
LFFNGGKLFALSPDGISFHPNNRSEEYSEDHLLFFNFVGRIIAKAIIDNELLEL